jgi:hypothetical protein
MGVYSKRESERCRREQPGGSGRHRRATARREGDEHSRRLFLADEFARKAGRVEDVQQGRGRAAGRSRRRRVRKYTEEDE